MNRGESNCYTSTKLGTLPGRPAKNTGQLGGETLLALTPGKKRQVTEVPCVNGVNFVRCLGVLRAEICAKMGDLGEGGGEKKITVSGYTHKPIRH